MAARNYPADTRLQAFHTEQFDKENATRLQWYLSSQRGGDPVKSQSAGGYRGVGLNGLPTINPMQFARNMKRKEDEEKQEIKREAQKMRTNVEMWPAEPKTRTKLYHGFTKEGKGRYEYLDIRQRVIPERKYTYPVTSSWQYGWKLDDTTELKKPPFARSRKINDTFYSRNGVPTLCNPSANVSGLNRAVTTL